MHFSDLTSLLVLKANGAWRSGFKVSFVFVLLVGSSGVRVVSSRSWKTALGLYCFKHRHSTASKQHQLVFDQDQPCVWK